MTDRLSILEVALESPNAIAASWVDYPKAGVTIDGDALEVVGWIVGQREPVTDVAIVEHDRELARCGMTAVRHDVAAAHPGSPQRGDVSFHVIVRDIDAGPHVFTVEASWANGTRATLGRIRLHAGRRPARAGAAILTYHRVNALPSEAWSLSVAPDHFEAQLDVMARSANVWPLSRLARALRDGTDIPPEVVVVTFDDGYADNLEQALPLLEKFGLPAALFVTTGFVGQSREFWWDALERVLLQPSRLPERLVLTIGGIRREWSLGDAALYREEQRREHRGWRAGAATAPTPRHRIYRELWDALMAATETDRRRVCDALAEWAGQPTEARATHRALTLDELHRMAANDLIEIGAHTVSHPQLAALPPAVQRVEIEASKHFLERELDRRVVSLAYPFGQPAHYSADTKRIAREAGFQVAMANHPSLVTHDSDRLALTRSIVADVGGEAFARHLSQLFR